MVAGGTLPPFCIVCGGPARHFRCPGADPPERPFAFWVTVLFDAYAPTVRTGGFPFCDDHQDYWRRRAWLMFGGLGLGLVLLSVAADRPRVDGLLDWRGDWPLSAAVTWAVAYITLLVRTVRVVGGDARTLLLVRSSEEFASALDRVLRDPE